VLWDRPTKAYKQGYVAIICRTQLLKDQICVADGKLVFYRSGAAGQDLKEWARPLILKMRNIRTVLFELLSAEFDISIAASLAPLDIDFWSERSVRQPGFSAGCVPGLTLGPITQRIQLHLRTRIWRPSSRQSLLWLRCLQAMLLRSCWWHVHRPCTSLRNSM